MTIKGKIKAVIRIGTRVTSYSLEDDILPFTNIEWSDEQVLPPE